MGTTASPAPAGAERDATAFGGLVPSGASARSDETLIAILGVEHFRDGAVAHAVVITDAPGLIDWDVEAALAVHDDLGMRYEASVLAKTQGLGQVVATIWLSPAIETGAASLTFHVEELLRITPPRGDDAAPKRALSGAPWRIEVELVPDRTVAEIPPLPERRQRFPDVGSVPSRSLTRFRSIVPIGQARHVDGAVIAVIGAELYVDRWLLTLAALARHDDPAPPAIGRARLTVWDDCGNRYRATPILGTSMSRWSETVMELVPPLADEARSFAIQIDDIPHGGLPAGNSAIPGPVVFGVRAVA